MTKIVLKEYFEDGVKLAEQSVESEEFDKIKSKVVDDPDKSGYTKDFLGKLWLAGCLTQEEWLAATVKASK